MIVRLVNPYGIWQDFETPLPGPVIFVRYDGRTWQRRTGQKAEPWIYDQVQFFSLDDATVLNKGRYMPENSLPETEPAD